MCLCDAAAVLVRDDGRKCMALFIHRDPGRAHDGERDAVHLFRAWAEPGNGLADGGEQFLGIHLDARADAV